MRTARECVRGHHDWQLVDPPQPPPRTLVCNHCGKHVPPHPSDPDYDEYGPAAGAPPTRSSTGQEGAS